MPGRINRTPSQQNIHTSLEIYLGTADQKKCLFFFFSPRYDQTCIGIHVKIPAFGLLLKDTTQNNLLVIKTNNHSVSIFLYLYLCENQNKAVNLHAKRVQKWPCTAERDETVQWAAANLVNDVRQSSFKNKEKETLPQLTKFLNMKKSFDLQHSFQAPQLQFMGAVLVSKYMTKILMLMQIYKFPSVFLFWLLPRETLVLLNRAFIEKKR